MKDTEMIALPLRGRRVLVTRAAHQAGKLSEGLRALGADPVEVPVLEIQPPHSFAALDRALRSLTNYDWLILTSANTVHALVDRAKSLGFPLAAPASLKVAAVGEATAAAARNTGLLVAIVPESYVAESLVDELLRPAQEAPGQDFTVRGETPSRGSLVSGHEFTRAANASDLTRALAPGQDFTVRGETPSRGSLVSGHEFTRAANASDLTRALAPEASFHGQRILLARAAIARDVIPDALRAAGATVDVVDAYRNVIPASAPALLREALGKGIDAATFTSSSSVTHLAKAARAAAIAFPFAGVAAISIGPVTTQTLRNHGWEPAAEASPSDIPGLIAAIRHVFSGD